MVKITDQLREKIEICLKPVLVGFFGQHSPGRTFKQPIVEIYSMNNFPKDIINNDDWNFKTKDWLGSFGIDVWENFFASDKCMFACSQVDSWIFPNVPENRYSFQLITSLEDHVEMLKEMGHHDNRYGLSDLYGRYIDEIIPLIITFQFLEVVKKNMNIISRITLKTIKGKRKIARYIQSSSSIQQEYVLLNRIKNEYNTWKGKMSKKIKNPLNMQYAAIGSDKVKATLFDQMIYLCDYRLKALSTQLGYIKEAFSDNFALSNIAITYRLQWISIVFTIISVIVAVIGLIAIWPTIEKALGI
jgi:hypothetical protein